MAMIAASSRPSGAIPTSSTADIAFLLLIFFLVTTVFPRDAGLALVLPRDVGDVSAANVLHLLVGPDGVVEVRHGTSPQGQFVSADDVGDLWRLEVAGNPNLIAAVKTDPDAAYGRMVDVLDQLHGAGAARISLQAIPR